MKVQELNNKSNNINFASHFWEPNHLYKFTDAAACDRNTLRYFRHLEAKDKYDARLARIDELIPPKGRIRRFLNNILKDCIPVPVKEKMEPTEVVRDELGRRVYLK